MLVLQSCTDLLQDTPGLSGDTFPSSSVGTYDVSNTEVEEDVVIIEESFIAVKKDEDIGMKQEEIPQDITFPDIKSEPDKVCYVCICLLLDTFYWCPEISVLFVTSLFLAT
jgi:hypothetical protein